jgi:hypothetical protein
LLIRSGLEAAARGIFKWAAFLLFSAPHNETASHIAGRSAQLNQRAFPVVPDL